MTKKLYLIETETHTVVPRNPSDGMIAEGETDCDLDWLNKTSEEVYKDMIAAAPEYPSIQVIPQTVPNTTILAFIMGWQGGTVHQVADTLGVSTSDILNADAERMEDLMRMAQRVRNNRDKEEIRCRTLSSKSATL